MRINTTMKAFYIIHILALLEIIAAVLAVSKLQDLTKKIKLLQTDLKQKTDMNQSYTIDEQFTRGKIISYHDSNLNLFHHQIYVSTFIPFAVKESHGFLFLIPVCSFRIKPALPE